MGVPNPRKIACPDAWSESDKNIENGLKDTGKSSSSSAMRAAASGSERKWKNNGNWGGGGALKSKGELFARGLKLKKRRAIFMGKTHYLKPAKAGRAMRSGKMQEKDLTGRGELA